MLNTGGAVAVAFTPIANFSRGFPIVSLAVQNSTNGTDRGSVASAWNVGVNVGANAGVAGTVQNTGIIGG